MATIFAAFGKTVGNNKGSIQNFGIVGITIATEELSKFIFFFCPCDYPRNQTYGSIFIWGPAIVLLIAGYLAHRRTWRLTTGLCNRTQRSKGKRIIHFFFIFASIGVKAMIAPATWVVLAFLKGDYYACAHWPDPDNDVAASRQFYKLEELDGNVSLPKPCFFNPNPAKFSSSSEAEVIARTLRAESHIIGWFYLTLGMLVSVTIMFCMRCQSNFSYEQSNYIQRYREHEVELFEEQLDAKAKDQAERIVTGFFSKTRAKEDWDRIAVINDKVTHSKRGKAIYSPLHRFVNKEKLREEGVCDGDIVQDAAQKTKRFGKSKQKPSNPSNPSAPNYGDASVPATQFIPMVAPTQKVVVKPTQPPQPVAKKEEPQPQKPAVNPSHEETTLSQPAAKPSKIRDNPPPPHAICDPSTSPTETESSPLAASSPDPSQSLTTESEAKTVLPAIPSSSPKERPRSLPPSGEDPLSESPKETSLGDFGGYYSREDLRKSLSISEEVDGADPASIDLQNDLSDIEVSDQSRPVEEDEIPLLENVEETSELIKNM